MNKLSNSKVHFIGVGGIGMCGLAELMHRMGAEVSGSDISENQNTSRLKDLGVTVYKGHKADNVTDVDVVVFSSAVRKHNIEMQEAMNKKIPIIPRAEALAEVMRLKRGIAVAGTHGKTTTTSLVSSIFTHQNCDPTIMVGGQLAMIGSTAQLGKGEWMIAESDESDGSFLKLSPELAVITNIDNDHMDFYSNFSNLQNMFVQFAEKIPFYGALVVCGDDYKVRDLFEGFSKKVIFYGFDKSNDYVLLRGEGEYSVEYESSLFTKFKSPLPGRHNALNSLAAIIVSQLAGLPVEKSIEAIENFGGVDRRFQKIGEVDDVLFYDDYGHHPTEVAAVISAMKENFPDKSLKIIFQPHRYSRTENSWREFTQCFAGADHLYLLDIYPAGEAPIPGVSSIDLMEQVKDVKITHIESLDKSIQDINVDGVLGGITNNEIILSLGAGNIWQLGREVYSRYKDKKSL